jgi:DNA (cytosine-5)-methyltransferase 1
MGMVTAFLAQYHSETQSHEARGQTLTRPILTLDTSNRYGLVTSNLIKLRGTCADGQPVTEPMPTITAGGLHVGEVRAFLLKYYGSADNGQKLDDPLHTVTTKDRFGLVTIEGTEYQIVDIGMRMLEPHELFAAQGFPPEYIIDRDADGKSYPKSAQVARCGNSVPPPFAQALVRANMPELCKKNLPYKANHQLEMQQM